MTQTHQIQIQMGQAAEKNHPGDSESHNQPKPVTTNQKHQQPTNPAKTTHNQPKPPITSQNQPKLLTELKGTNKY